MWEDLLEDFSVDLALPLSNVNCLKIVAASVLSSWSQELSLDSLLELGMAL